VIRRWRWHLALAGLLLAWTGYADDGAGQVENPYRDRPSRRSGYGSCGRRAYAPDGLVVLGGLTLRRPLHLAGFPAKCLRC
jgi:hypothetical protein